MSPYKHVCLHFNAHVFARICFGLRTCACIRACNFVLCVCARVYSCACILTAAMKKVLSPSSDRMIIIKDEKNPSEKSSDFVCSAVFPPVVVAFCSAPARIHVSNIQRPLHCMQQHITALQLQLCQVYQGKTPHLCGCCCNHEQQRG